MKFKLKLDNIINESSLFNNYSLYSDHIESSEKLR